MGIPSSVQDLGLGMGFFFVVVCWGFFEIKMLETRIRVASSDHLRVPAPQPTAWHLILGSSLWCHGLPTAAKIFWLFCALLWGELPEIGACSAIPVANHQSSSQSYLACIMGTGWSFYLQRPGSTDSLRSISTDGLFISFLFEGTTQIIWGKACSLHRRCCEVTCTVTASQAWMCKKCRNCFLDR